ncbi:MAG: DUF2156 domain-containing protein [Candidatus Levybacteria bacterium]|nr:DUF2156 domain-containing protein [Candidatus Levybacteria bacterium]
MLPLYPNFKNLELEDKDSIEEITNKFPPYSDFNFVSLYSYNTDNDALISNLNDNLVIKFRDYITNEPFYSFLGNTKVVETAKELLERAKKENAMDILQLIPESVIHADIRLIEDFDVTEDRNNFDYVLDVPEISTLEGEKYHNKRNAVNRFHSENPGYEVKIIDASDEKIQKEIIDLFDLWVKVRNKNIEEAEHEKKAIIRLIQAANKLNLLAIGIYINKKMVGFAVAEILKNEYAIFHFIKANTEHKGIFESLYMLKAKELMKNQIKFWNIEQDLGIENLRMSKEQWNPAHFLKKYIIKNKI